MKEGWRKTLLSKMVQGGRGERVRRGKSEKNIFIPGLRYSAYYAGLEERKGPEFRKDHTGGEL